MDQELQWSNGIQEMFFPNFFMVGNGRQIVSLVPFKEKLFVKREFFFVGGEELFDRI